MNFPDIKLDEALDAQEM